MSVGPAEIATSTTLREVDDGPTRTKPPPLPSNPAIGESESPVTDFVVRLDAMSRGTIRSGDAET